MKDRKYTGPFITAVIVAAGKSERMGGLGDKQFLDLDGMPVIVRTLSVFEACRAVSRIIVVTREDAIPHMGAVVKEYGFGKVNQIVKGGSTRQQSVMVGYRAANLPPDNLIAFHDGARPLVTPESIERVAKAAAEYGAAAAAIHVKDTVKYADPAGFVASTPERSRLWAVQTPQIFRSGLFRKALAYAEQCGADYTDDCQIVEAYGAKVKLVEGGYANIKITTGEDLWVARAILQDGGKLG